MNLAGWSDEDSEAAYLLGVLERPAWHARAACRGMGPELFFYERGEDQADAKAVCADCPVRPECAEFALAMPITLSGMWGGMSQKERWRLKRSAA